MKQGIGKSVSISFKRMVITFEVVNAITSFVNDVLADIISSDVFQSFHKDIEIFFTDFLLIGAVASVVLWVEEGRKFFARR